jgi:hypothetical protein
MTDDYSSITQVTVAFELTPLLHALACASFDWFILMLLPLKSTLS